MTETLRPVQIFNTMSRQKEELRPLEPGKVKMYACGPTVYNLFHLGNARMLVTFDLFRCFLEYLGYEVTFVQNFTDIDDKVIRQANLEGISYKELAERYIQEYFYDADRLGVRRATVQPRATESMEEIIQLVQTLVDKGYCYVNSDGVYFETRKFDDYGKLSKQDLSSLVEDAAERVGKNEDKRHPEDFAVWKFAKPGEPAWESPWGAGRPGWHIECSAMNHKFLGDTIDIHCGGSDLIFPHHENEIAQSEAAHGCTFARYWMHNGFITVDKMKMSKSKGNFFTVRDLAQHFSYDSIRFFMLQGQYRNPINFSPELLEAAGRAYQRIKNCLQRLRAALEAGTDSASSAPQAETEALGNILEAFHERFVTAMCDDMNTPDALAAIYDLVAEANRYMDAGGQDSVLLGRVQTELLEKLGVLGFQPKFEDALPEEILALLDERLAAKKARDYARADAIRQQVLEAGYKIEDGPQGSRALPL